MKYEFVALLLYIICLLQVLMEGVSCLKCCSIFTVTGLTSQRLLLRLYQLTLLGYHEIYTHFFFTRAESVCVSCSRIKLSRTEYEKQTVLWGSFRLKTNGKRPFMSHIKLPSRDYLSWINIETWFLRETCVLHLFILKICKRVNKASVFVYSDILKYHK